MASVSRVTYFSTSYLAIRFCSQAHCIDCRPSSKITILPSIWPNVAASASAHQGWLDSATAPPM